MKRGASHRFWGPVNILLMSQRMIALATLLALVHQASGTPYVSGGDTARGTDCSGLASWVSNVATGRPQYGDRFNTGNEESALRGRGFKPGTAPGALVIGWNSRHTAVTLPDGSAVSSGEGGGVRFGGGGAYQRQFTHHMFLPMAADQAPAPVPDMVAVNGVNTELPPPPADPMAPPPPADPGVVDAGNITLHPPPGDVPPPPMAA